MGRLNFSCNEDSRLAGAGPKLLRPPKRAFGKHSVIHSANSPKVHLGHSDGMPLLKVKALMLESIDLVCSLVDLSVRQSSKRRDITVALLHYTRLVAMHCTPYQIALALQKQSIVGVSDRLNRIVVTCLGYSSCTAEGWHGVQCCSFCVVFLVS